MMAYWEDVRRLEDIAKEKSKFRDRGITAHDIFDPITPVAGGLSKKGASSFRLVIINKLDYTLLEDLDSFENTTHYGKMRKQCARMRFDLRSNSFAIEDFDNIGRIPGKTMLDGVVHYGIATYTFEPVRRNGGGPLYGGLSFTPERGRNDEFGVGEFGPGQQPFGVVWNAPAKDSKRKPGMTISFNMSYWGSLQALFDGNITTKPQSSDMSVLEVFDETTNKQNNLRGRAFMGNDLPPLVIRAFGGQETLLRHNGGKTCVVLLEQHEFKTPKAKPKKAQKAKSMGAAAMMAKARELAGLEPDKFPASAAQETKGPNGWIQATALSGITGFEAGSDVVGKKIAKIANGERRKRGAPKSEFEESVKRIRRNLARSKGKSVKSLTVAELHREVLKKMPWL
jgi:hypothetical protein